MTGWSRACVYTPNSGLSLISQLLFYLTLTCDGVSIGDELSGLMTHWLSDGAHLCSELVNDLLTVGDESASRSGDHALVSHCDDVCVTIGVDPFCGARLLAIFESRHCSWSLSEALSGGSYLVRGAHESPHVVAPCDQEILKAFCLCCHDVVWSVVRHLKGLVT